MLVVLARHLQFFMSLLYPEIIDVIIDDIAADMRSEARGWLNGPMDHDISPQETPESQELITSRGVLKKCSLISKAWYFRAGKYIWRTITVDGYNPDAVVGLVAFLAKRRDIVALIKHVDLRASWDDHPQANEWIGDLARILAPVTSLSLIYPPKRGKTYHRWDNSLPHHPFLGTLMSPCALNNLTSLHYEGEIFPIMLLEHTPNLRDFSLQGPCNHDPNEEDTFTRIQAHLRAFDRPASQAKLSFRLERARFGKVDQRVLAEFVEHHPQVFSQLKELYFPIFLQNYEMAHYRSLKDLTSLGLIRSTRETLETLAVGIDRIPKFSTSCFFSSPARQC